MNLIIFKRFFPSEKVERENIPIHPTKANIDSIAISNVLECDWNSRGAGQGFFGPWEIPP